MKIWFSRKGIFSSTVKLPTTLSFEPTVEIKQEYLNCTKTFEKSKTKFTIFRFCFEQKTTLRWCAFYLGKVYVVIMYVFNSNEITRSKDGTKNPEKNREKMRLTLGLLSVSVLLRPRMSPEIGEADFGTWAWWKEDGCKDNNRILIFLQSMI